MESQKKYVCKNKKVLNSNNDGIDNSEHVVDIIQEIEMLYSNIKNNTDIGIELYKFKKQSSNDGDDILDAMQIACEKIIELEKSASEIYSDFSAIVKQIDRKYENSLKEIYQNMQKIEEISRKTMESLLN